MTKKPQTIEERETPLQLAIKEFERIQNEDISIRDRVYLDGVLAVLIPAREDEIKFLQSLQDEKAEMMMREIKGIFPNKYNTKAGDKYGEGYVDGMIRVEEQVDIIAQKHGIDISNKNK